MSTRKTGGKGSGTGARSGGRKRHSPTTRKPATIDVEPNKVTAKPDATGTTDAAKPNEAKGNEAKGNEAKPADAKPTDATVAPATAGKAETAAGGGAAGAKAEGTKADPKAGDAKTAAAAKTPGPSATQAAETKTPDTKAPDTKANDPKAPGTTAPGTKAAETKAAEKSGSVPKVSADKPAGGTDKPAAKPDDRPGQPALGRSGSVPAAAAMPVKPGATPNATPNATGGKPADAKPGDGKPTKARPSDAKPGDGKSTVTSTATPNKADDTKRPTPAALVPPPPGGGGSDTPRAATPAPREKGGAGFLSLLVAGLLGGAATLGGAWALGAFDDEAAVLRDERTALRTELDGRIAAVEQAERPAGITPEQVDAAIAAALEAERAQAPTGPDEATAGRLVQLENELATARASLAALEDAPPVADSSEALDQARAVIAALETRVGQLAERLDAAENAGGSGLSAERATALTNEVVTPLREQTDAVRGQVGELAERVDTLSTTVSERGRALEETRTTLNDVQQTLTQLREGQEALGTRLEERIASATTTLRERLDKVDATTENLRTDLDAGLKAAEERTATLRTDLQGAVDGVKQSVSDLDGKVTATTDELRQSLDTARTELSESLEAARTELTARFDDRALAVDGRLKVIEDDIADTGPEERAAAALALANLRTRLDAGEPYETELALVRDTQAQADLEPLRVYATEGIMTLPELRDSFDEAADLILAATRPEADGAVDGLFANLRDVVKVRRAGDDSDGGSPRAIIADIRGALAGGDLVAADRAWQRLPTAGKNASSNWHGRLLARIQAGTILPAAVNRLIQGAG